MRFIRCEYIVGKNKKGIPIKCNKLVLYDHPARKYCSIHSFQSKRDSNKKASKKYRKNKTI